MIAINLNNISKMYRIYAKPSHKLKEGVIRGIFRSGKRYHREFWALKDINLSIPKGVTLGIIGQNGSGKSTLLQIITGILQPTSGVLQVDGRISALLELGAGFNREFSGRENVFMNGAIMGLSRQEMEDRFDQIAAFADIGQFIEQPVKTYSSGMYVRLAFATAVHIDPEILIVDEALAVGDMMFQRKCYRRMEEFRKEGKTIILVTHAMQTVRSFCNHAVLLDGGRIIEEGDPNLVVNTYNKLMASREEARSGKKNDTRLDRFVDSQQEAGGGEFRYGDGGAEVVDFSLVGEGGDSTQVVESGKVFCIRSKVRFNRPVERPLMGMLVKTLTGVQVYGTTTDHAGCPIGPVDAGTVCTVEFNQVCRLNPGAYVMSVGVSEDVDSEIRPLDRRMDALAFRVVGKENTLGLIDSDVRVRIVEKGRISEGTLHLS